MSTGCINCGFVGRTEKKQRTQQSYRVAFSGLFRIITSIILLLNCRCRCRFSAAAPWLQSFCALFTFLCLGSALEHSNISIRAKNMNRSYCAFERLLELPSPQNRPTRARLCTFAWLHGCTVSSRTQTVFFARQAEGDALYSHK